MYFNSKTPAFKHLCAVYLVLTGKH